MPKSVKGRADGWRAWMEALRPADSRPTGVRERRVYARRRRAMMQGIAITARIVGEGLKDVLSCVVVKTTDAGGGCAA